jgi:hypothetical protein
MRKSTIGSGKISQTLIVIVENIWRVAVVEKSKKIVTFLTLFIAIAAVLHGDEVTAEILFEPQKNQYGFKCFLDTNGDEIADKTIDVGFYTSVSATSILSNYLVRGAKIVYENKGMKNEPGESVSTERIIGIITINGKYIELTQLLTPYDIGYYFPYLFEKLKREGRLNQ